MTRKTLIAAMALCAVLFIFCIDKYNPFDDPSNILALVESKTFDNGDSVSIFASETLYVTPQLKEKIHSITLRADDNRLWPNDSLTLHNNDTLIF